MVKGYNAVEPLAATNDLVLFVAKTDTVGIATNIALTKITY